MKIRRYRPGEEKELWQIYLDTTHTINRKDYTEEQTERWAPKNKNLDEWSMRIKSKNPFVVDNDGTILGFAELDSDGHIDYFYCHHDWQRKGVGKLLYSAVEQEALRKRLPYLFAEVSVSAKEFFLRMGFKISEETNNVVCGQPAKQYIMKKQLKQE